MKLMLVMIAINSNSADGFLERSLRQGRHAPPVRNETLGQSSISSPSLATSHPAAVTIACSLEKSFRTGFELFK